MCEKQKDLEKEAEVTKSERECERGEPGKSSWRGGERLTRCERAV